MVELVFEEQKGQANGKKVNSQNTFIVIFALSSWSFLVQKKNNEKM